MGQIQLLKRGNQADRVQIGVRTVHQGQIEARRPPWALVVQRFLNPSRCVMNSAPYASLTGFAGAKDVGRN